jgi:hypothetical protein
MKASNRICWVVGSSLAFMSCGSDPESPAAKHEWSVLEAVEARNTLGESAELEWSELSGYHFVGLRSNAHHIWIMLDPAVAPYYKQIPRGNYQLTARELQKIKDKGFANSTVIECLSSHVASE